MESGDGLACLDLRWTGASLGSLYGREVSRYGKYEVRGVFFTSLC